MRLTWGGDYVTPNVSFIEHTSTQEEQQVRFQPYIPPYLTFTAEQAGSKIMLRRMGTDTSLANAVLQYSTDSGKTWNNYTLKTDITLTNVGDSVKFKGTNETLGYGLSNYHKFVMSGKIKASGDVTSLLNEKGGDVALSDYCYYGMFWECASLTQAPELPSTTLASDCYHAMFQSCTGLIQAPELPAMTLAGGCYWDMFNGCTSLTQAPKLPATVLAPSCYNRMFQLCTSLTKAPELPATTLVNACYDEMFRWCTSLTKAPELPATTLAKNCYSGMFRDCTNIVYIKAMFRTTPSYKYTGNWVSGVASSGTFIKNSSAWWDVTGTDGIPEGWTVQTAAA